MNAQIARSPTREVKEVFHIIPYEPIYKRPTSKSFQEPSVNSVRIDLDVIGTFWRVSTRELYRIT